MACKDVNLSGLKIKKLRYRLGLSIRDVALASRKVAEKNGDNRYMVSSAQLADAENHGQKLGVHKICSLAVIYQRSVLEMLALLGVDVYKGLDYRDCFCTTITHPIDLPLSPAGVEAPTRMDPDYNRETTVLLNQIIMDWGMIPFEFLNRNLFQKFLYAYIGQSDNLMYPILRPGAIVKVDTREKVPQNNMWPNEFERPLYLVETSSGWRCAWCKREGSNLVLVPHPLSQKIQEIYRMRSGVKIIGQVVGGWNELNPVTRT